MYGSDPARLLVFSFPAERQRNLGEQVISSGNFDERSLRLLYPQRSGALVGLDLQHCFPFGDGRGFLTRSGFIHGNPEARKQSGTVKESAEDQPDFVLLNTENGVIVPVVMSGACARAQFGCGTTAGF